MNSELIKDKFNENINDFKTAHMIDYGFLLAYINHIFNNTTNPNEVFNIIVNDYLKMLNGISKLSPGLSTCLFDSKNNININTYSGYTNDTEGNAIDKETLFDLSSMTKLFTSILLLNEEEKGNIDLNKTYGDYSKLLPQLNVRIIDSLKFGNEILTNGRLDDINISKEERLNRLLNSYVYKTNTFKYSDIPYMLMPLLFSNNIIESNEIYFGKINDLLRSNNLLNTGYNYQNMTGGFNGEIFDPKAKLFIKDQTLIPTHAGLTSTVEDIKKLFILLNNGLISKDSIQKLITPVDPEHRIIITPEGKKIVKNRAMSVYINIDNIYLSDIIPRLSENAFSSAGSTGTFTAFDLDNGLNISILSNIKSMTHNRIINTGEFTYGYEGNIIPYNKDVVIMGGNNSIVDGSILKENNERMSFVLSTSYFKEECLNTLLKLRISKQILESIYGKNKELDGIFNRDINTNVEKKLELSKRA